MNTAMGETVSTKNRATTLLLAFFLGGLGIHRFYVGKKGSAIAQLLLTLTIVGALATGVWVLVDMIRIASGTFEDAEGRRIATW
ncbi:MAG TPA: TM2 domain-containing protein [Alphaproteobacteria bacterium]|jgi:TM2 domain-containing membrane protein YozV